MKRKRTYFFPLCSQGCTVHTFSHMYLHSFALEFCRTHPAERLNCTWQSYQNAQIRQILQATSHPLTHSLLRLHLTHSRLLSTTPCYISPKIGLSPTLGYISPILSYISSTLGYSPTTLLLHLTHSRLSSHPLGYTHPPTGLLNHN